MFQSLVHCFRIAELSLGNVPQLGTLQTPGASLGCGSEVSLARENRTSLKGKKGNINMILIIFWICQSILVKMVRSVLRLIKQSWQKVGEWFWIDLEDLFILETSILVHCGPSCFNFGENRISKSQHFKTDSNQPPSYKMLKMIIGSRHDFDNRSISSFTSNLVACRYLLVFRFWL